MMDRVNLWQLRAECLRSLGKQSSDGSEQQEMEIAAYQDSHSALDNELEMTSCDGLFDVLCTGVDEIRHTAKNAA